MSIIFHWMETFAYNERCTLFVLFYFAQCSNFSKIINPQNLWKTIKSICFCFYFCHSNNYLLFHNVEEWVWLLSVSAPNEYLNEAIKCRKTVPMDSIEMMIIIIYEFCRRFRLLWRKRCGWIENFNKMDNLIFDL